MVFKKEQPTSDVVVGKKEKLSTRLQRKAQNTTKKQRIGLLIALGVTFVLVLVLIYAYGEYKGNESPSENVAVSVCGADESLISTFNTALNDNDAKKMQEITGSITNRTDYDKDINCLYILTQSAIVQGSSVEARAALDAHNQLYDSGATEYGGVLKITAATPETLKQKVDFLEQQKKSQQESINVFSPEVESNE